MKAPNIVVDTNVLVAGLRSNRGASFQLLSHIGTGKFDIRLSVPLLLEYEEVLLREPHHFGLSKEAIDDVVNYLCSVAGKNEIFYLWRPYLPDPSDDMVLELAANAGCEFIVTYNVKDFTNIEQFGVCAIEPFPFLKHLGILT